MLYRKLLIYSDKFKEDSPNLLANPIRSYKTCTFLAGVKATRFC